MLRQAAPTPRRSTALALALLAGACSAGEPRPAECLRTARCERIQVIAHRGFRGFGAPENTLAAMRDAARVGADGIETDPRATFDGTLIVMHDPTVDRTTDGRGEVRALTVAEIRALRVRDADPSDPLAGSVPTFDEVLALAREKALVVVADVNKTDRVDLVAAAVARARMQAGTIISSSDRTKLAAARRIDPALALMPRVETLGELDATTAEIGPVEVVELEASVSAELVQGARARGVKAMASALGGPDVLAFAGQPGAYEAFLEARPNLVQTDLADKLLAAIRR